MNITSKTKDIGTGVEENQLAVNGDIFTLPKIIKLPYSWIEHIPFAFFLISILKPKILVELGVYAGNSYNAFCQAVSFLKTDTQCYGIDTWHGDKHSNFYDDSIYNELFAYQQREYSTFSFLLRGSFDDMLESFEDNVIDLLHIDGYHTYEAVKHDFNNWLPKMSDQGVIIFHDTEVREQDFGVWRLWEELALIYPSFNFTHGYGLGIIAVGTQVPQAFLNFLKVANQTVFYQELFARLGRYIAILEQNKMLERVANSQPLVAQLFIDTGDEFEKGYSFFKMVTGQETQLEFDLSACPEIKRLCFAPLNDFTMLEKQQFVVLDAQGGRHLLADFQTTPSYTKENYLVFATNNPQILFDIRHIHRPLKVVFQFKYVMLGEKTCRILWEIEREQTRQLASRVQQLEQVLQTAEGHGKD